MPAKSFRRLKQTSFSTTTGDKWVDDGISGSAYFVDNSDGYCKPIIDVEGAPMMAVDGKASELLVVMDAETGGVTVGNQWDAIVYCRPRRRTL